MNKKRLITALAVAVATLVLHVNANAEVKPLSRANCTPLPVNESVTYDRPAFDQYYMTTTSFHIGLGELEGHTVIAAPEMTARSYAGDNLDPGTYRVSGYHVWSDLESDQTFYATTETTDCSLSEW